MPTDTIQQKRAALTAASIARLDLPPAPQMPERLRSIAPDLVQWEAVHNQRIDLLAKKVNEVLDFLKQ